MRRLILAATLMSPMWAMGHGGERLGHWWSFDPWIWIPMLVVVTLYLRGLFRMRRSVYGKPAGYRVASFATGMASLFLALIWPLDALSGISFAAHMTQHMLLIAIAAPLLALAKPRPILIAGLSVRVRRFHRHLILLYKLTGFFTKPALAFTLHAFIIWIWHAPLMFELALRFEWLHVTEHLLFLSSALIFWNALHSRCRSDGRGYGTALIGTLGTMMHTGLLGALMTFSPSIWYTTNANLDHHILTPLEDQQLAGLVMWIPGGMCYLIAGIAFAAGWLRIGSRGAARKTADLTTN